MFRYFFPQPRRVNIEDTGRKVRIIFPARSRWLPSLPVIVAVVIGCWQLGQAFKEVYTLGKNSTLYMGFSEWAQINLVDLIIRETICSLVIVGYMAYIVFYSSIVSIIAGPNLMQIFYTRRGHPCSIECAAATIKSVQLIGVPGAIEIDRAVAYLVIHKLAGRPFRFFLESKDRSALVSIASRVAEILHCKAQIDIDG